MRARSLCTLLVLVVALACPSVGASDDIVRVMVFPLIDPAAQDEGGLGFGIAELARTALEGTDGVYVYPREEVGIHLRGVQGRLRDCDHLTTPLPAGKRAGATYVVYGTLSSVGVAYRIHACICEVAKGSEQVLWDVDLHQSAVLDAGATLAKKVNQRLMLAASDESDTGAPPTIEAMVAFSRGVAMYYRVHELRREYDPLAWEDSISWFDEAIRRSAAFGEAYGARALVLQAKGDLDKAIMDYDRAIELKSRCAETYNNRGTARHKRADLDGAMADYDRAVDLNPQCAEAYSNRGAGRAEKGDLDGALSDYDCALRLNPAFAPAYFNRANDYKTNGKLDQAIREYDHALEVNPSLAEAYCNRGNARHAKGEGDMDGALGDYNRALELNPRYGLAYYNRAQLRGATQDFVGAVSDCKKALELKFLDAPIYSRLAVFHTVLGEYDSAWDCIRHAKARGSKESVDPKFLKALQGLSGRTE